MDRQDVNEDILGLGDPEKVAYIMQVLGVNTDDFKDPTRTQRIKDLMEYLKNHPDPDYFIYKAVGSKQIDRVDFMHEYLSLVKGREHAEQQLESIKKQIEVYEK